MAWLEANLYICWLVAGGIFIGTEMLSGTAVIFFLGLGCLAAAAGDLCGFNFDWQLIVFMAASAGSFILLRRKLKNWLNRSDQKVSDNYIGCTVLVVSAISPDAPGKVELNGVVWQAASSGYLLPGQRALISDHRGLLLLVKPVDDKGE
ncbi:MAG: NfeD family protein [Desulfarculales bacterium]|jgi:membrane protein implicated in regulation of membrane protease activity|nr:NfeD family protein [Desulfarculales bacterium]